jgi:nicotinamidase-related amidase
MTSLSICKAAAVAGALALAGGLIPAAGAQTIVDEWAAVEPPAAPELESVTIANPETTALLMLDFVPSSCNEERRPRCVASLPRMKQLLEDARAAGLMVVHSVTGSTTIDDIMEDVAPAEGEPWVQARADKFLRSDLEQILADRGIETVIAVGVAAHGAVLYTVSGAAWRDMQVIVPVDGISSENTYFEQYAVYHLTNAPGVGSNVTLTTTDMIQF